MSQRDELASLITRQLEFFGYTLSNEIKNIDESIDLAFQKTSSTLQIARNIPKEFNYLHSLHYTVFLYKLAREIYLNNENSSLPDKIYLLNKMLNSIDLYFKVDMPEHFLIGHGIGIIFSKASYGNHLVVFQNVTIGTQDDKYPTIGEKVVIYPNCVIAGSTKIGENSIIGAGTVLINKTIPANSIAFYQDGQLVIKDNLRNEISKYFDFQ